MRNPKYATAQKIGKNAANREIGSTARRLGINQPSTGSPKEPKTMDELRDAAKAAGIETNVVEVMSLEAFRSQVQQATQINGLINSCNH